MTKKEHLKWWDKNLTEKEFEFNNWLNESDNDSRNYLYALLDNSGEEIVSTLECGPGTFIDYENYFKTHPEKKYSAIDITDNIVRIGKEKNVDIVLSSIENIEKNSNEFDLVYCRHVLEHQDHFEKSITEMLRVSKKYVVAIFWLLTEGESKINYDATQGLYHNSYSKKEIEDFLTKNNCKYKWWNGKNDKVLVIKKSDL